MLLENSKKKKMKTTTFSSIAFKTTLVHTTSYFIVGFLAFMVFDYSVKYADPVVAATLRQTNHPLVLSGPLFQILRGLLFGIVFYSLRDTFISRQRGWIISWLTLVIVGILSPFSSAPGSIEGIVYTTLPMWFHIMSLPELLVQSFLLAFLTHFWINHPEKKWLSLLFKISFTIIILLVLLGLLSALKFLPAPT